MRRALGPQHDFQSGSSPWGRDEPEPPADRGCAGPHVLQALAGGDLGFVKTGSVVDDGDEAFAAAPFDPHLRPPRPRVLARAREPLLDDAEDLDLLVGR